MDLVRIPGSRIFEIAKLAFATPDVDFLCFGESDQPSPQVAHAAAVAALDAGETKYIDVRGLPALRVALADYLTALHARPVTESRVQISASGMAAVSVAPACSSSDDGSSPEGAVTALIASARAGDRRYTPSIPT